MVGIYLGREDVCYFEYFNNERGTWCDKRNLIENNDDHHDRDMPPKGCCFPRGRNSCSSFFIYYIY